VNIHVLAAERVSTPNGTHEDYTGIHKAQFLPYAGGALIYIVRKKYFQKIMEGKVLGMIG
jgi:hypothetical protein